MDGGKMKRTTALLAVLLLLGVPTGLVIGNQDKKIEEEETRPAGQATVRVDVQQIRVDVTVRNKKGNLVVGLEKGNFEVYEDKIRQEITFFEPIEAPLTAVMVTEYTRAMPWEVLYEALEASYTFVSQMRQGDWVAVIRYNLKPEILVDFTQNEMEVYNAVRALGFPTFSDSNLYDTLYDTLDRVQELDQRTAIVLLSSGVDTFSKRNLGETLKRVKRSNTVIYAVSLGGNFRSKYSIFMPSTTRLDHYQADAVLKSITKSTGGEAYFPRFISQFNGIFQDISLLLRNQYSLGYVSTNTKKDGKYHKIKVKVNADVDGDGKPDKLKVRHREGYLAEEAG
jgi:VWFA-related protein